MTEQNFTWKSAYAVGDAAIDEQHRRLFELANDLLRAEDRAALNAAMEHLHQYVQLHFRHEEDLMRRIAYPRYRDHAEMHDDLMERLHALSVDIACGLRRSEGLRDFMNDWLLGHIAEHDTRLAAFVHARVGGAAGR
jgi:hemerythrin